MVPRRTSLFAAAVVVIGGLVPVGAPAASAEPVGPRLHRSEGVADFLATPSGDGVHPLAGRTPAAAGSAHLARYAASFGIDDPATELDRSEVRRSGTGGTILRYQQRAGGLPVLGGELVLTLDEDNALTSALGNLTPAASVAQATWPAAKARRSALTITAKAHGLDESDLGVVDQGSWVFDAEVLGVPGLPGARPAYRFEVGNGTDVRELVLVDAALGRILWHSNQVDAISRVICDNHNSRVGEVSCARGEVSQTRLEGGAASAIPDVNTAYDLLGVTSDLYADVAGLDLTVELGSGDGVSFPKRLAANVRWCDTGGACPVANAFWSGAEMYFGEGYAGADDVVAHELTHGVIGRFSDLFYFYQSGAINESLADIMGEIGDRRTVTAGEAPDTWQLGEDIPGGAIRNLADPTVHGQPDRMTSSLYAADPTLADNGAVHTNSGVGNKAAYLISQGGTFNGVTITGIDGSDPTLAKTATLYAEVIKRLGSGSEYADLARVLQQTCVDFAAAGTAGFGEADCVSVAGAITATEMTSAPVVAGATQSAETTVGCPEGTFPQGLTPSTEAQSTFAWGTAPRLWFQAPSINPSLPSNATSGTKSWYGADPDPTFDGGTSSHLEFKNPISIPADQQAYLRFNQWRAFETRATNYPDGGLVTIGRIDATGTTVLTTDALPWQNGPQETLALGGSWGNRLGFGGDSHGWVSSRVDLSSFAGKQIKPRFTVAGDSTGALIGWFLDDIELYTCAKIAPTAPTAVVAIGGLDQVKVTWAAPSALGQGVTGYRVTRDGSAPQTFAPGTTSATFRGLTSATRSTVRVVALGQQGTESPEAVAQVAGVSLALKATPVRLLKSTSYATFSGRVLVPGGAGVKGVRVLLQRRIRSSTYSFATVKALTTRADGTFSVRFRPGVKYEYRAYFAGSAGFMGGYSPLVKPRLR